jgi:hypothetical protein
LGGSGDATKKKKKKKKKKTARLNDGKFLFPFFIFLPWPSDDSLSFSLGLV